MSTEPFIGEIKLFGGNFQIRGYAFCSGQLLSIAENTALFSLIGTIYGGDGQTTFALPNLQGRFPIHQGQGPGLSPRTIGEVAGTETVTILPNQLPVHTHSLSCAIVDGNSTNPANNFWAPQPALGQYAANPSQASMKSTAISNTGGNQPHENMVPYLTINYLIALEGIFPSRN
jgi:microcystin-dependent protein